MEIHSLYFIITVFEILINITKFIQVILFLTSHVSVIESININKFLRKSRSFPTYIYFHGL